MVSNVVQGSPRDKKTPTSTRLSRFERAFIKIAAAKVQQERGDGYSTSDFLRDSALERAEQVLGQHFADYSAAA